MKSYSFLASILCAVIVSGCSNINLQDAIDLSQEGVKLSKATSSYYQDTRFNLDQYIEATALDSALNEHTPPSEEALKSINGAKEGLLAREVIFSSLSKTYVSLGNLASFDSTTEIQKNITSLAESIESYRQQVQGSPPSTNKKPETLISNLGGFLVSEQQKSKLKQSSKLIRDNLQAFKSLLALDHKVLLSVQGVVIDAKSDAAKSLIRSGFGDPESLVARQLSAFSLNTPKSVEAELIAETRKTYISDLKAYKKAIASNSKNPPPLPKLPPLYGSLLNVIDAKAATEKSTQEALLIEIENSIDKLINMHLQFEHGTPISIESITERLVNLRALLDQLNTSNSTPTNK
ncbi:hypothetical protein QS468_48025 [Bacillus subtilis]|nr:hypothetical protein [Pseudomonas sp. A29(2023)]MDL5600530.1 hypothetical protein [Bacillus subtilis]